MTRRPSRRGLLFITVALGMLLVFYPSGRHYYGLYRQAQIYAEKADRFLALKLAARKSAGEMATRRARANGRGPEGEVGVEGWDRLESFHLRQADYYDRMVDKYRHSASHPWELIDPDPKLPQ
jgi:hypothetical protein